MTVWLAISSAIAMSSGLAGGDAAHPWLTHQDPIRPVDAGVADLHELATSNFQPPIDLRLPNRFESVFRYSDVKHTGNPWDFNHGAADSSGRFVRFAGGVAAVFPYSSYRPSRAGRLAEIPAGTVYRLDLRPPAPGDVVYTPPPAPSYNQLLPQPAIALRDLGGLVQSRRRSTPVVADLPAERKEPHGLWNDELFRGRVLADLLDSTRLR